MSYTLNWVDGFVFFSRTTINVISQFRKYPTQRQNHLSKKTKKVWHDQEWQRTGASDG